MRDRRSESGEQEGFHPRGLLLETLTRPAQRGRTCGVIALDHRETDVVNAVSV